MTMKNSNCLDSESLPVILIYPSLSRQLWNTVKMLAFECIFFFANFRSTARSHTPPQLIRVEAEIFTEKN